MKRLFAVLLGLTMILGFASVASAVDINIWGDMTIGGNLQNGYWEWDYPCCYPLGYHLFVKASDTFGNASADVTFGFTYEDYFGVVDANLIYNINDVLSVGLKYVGEDPWTGYGATRYTKLAVFDEYNDCDYDNYLDYDDAYFVAGANLGKGAVVAYWEAEDGDLYAGGEYTFGRLVVGGGLWYCSGCGGLDFFDLYGKYAISDNLALAGEYMSDDGDGYIGVKADYANGPFAVSGTVAYDINDGDFQRLAVEGSYDINDKVTVKAGYDSNYDDQDPLTWEEIGGLSLGVACQLAPNLKLESAYYLSEDRLGIQATYSF